jgi:hypothetical protein
MRSRRARSAVEGPVRDPTTQFFERLDQSRPSELSPKVRATMRFDLTSDGDVRHWFLDFENGTVRVSMEEREADCVINGDRKLFDGFVEGESNIFSAWFRNEIGLAGDAGLMSVLRHIMPGPPAARDPGATARTGGRGR